MNHYVVTSGEYSDYGICGVFSSESEAIQYISSQKWEYDTPRIEVYDGDSKEKILRYEIGGFAPGTITLFWERKN